MGQFPNQSLQAELITNHTLESFALYVWVSSPKNLKVHKSIYSFFLKLKLQRFVKYEGKLISNFNFDGVLF